MSNKKENDVVRERNSGRISHPVRSSSARKLNTDADRKADEFSEGAKRTAKGGVSMNEPRKTGVKRTISSAVQTVRAPVQETPCVSIKGGSPVSKHTASSLAKKETRGGLETSKVTQTTRIGKQADAPVQKTAVRTVSLQKGLRAKVQLDKKELSAVRQKSEPPASSAKRVETKSPCGASKQPAITINPSPPIKPKKPIKISGKEHLPKDQTSQAKQIQGKQLEYEASISESSLESDADDDYEDHHIEWDGFSKPDKIEVCCCLCERDLGVQPTEDGGRNAYYVNTTMPVVAILPCGHAFHVDCLYYDEFELKPGGEPACVICESTMTD